MILCWVFVIIVINGINIIRRKNVIRVDDFSFWYKKYIVMYVWIGLSNRRCSLKMDLWLIFVVLFDIRLIILLIVYFCLVLLESLVIYKEKIKKGMDVWKFKKNGKLEKFCDNIVICCYIFLYMVL